MAAQAMSGFAVNGARAVVVGAGRSGRAAAALLARRGADVLLSDVRPAVDEAASLRALGVELELGGHDPATAAGADLIVMSPGVSPGIPAVARARDAGVPVISEVELAARWLRGRLVAVTGTKGKSTTTVLAGHMLDADGRRVVVGGNLGPALSSQVDASAPDVIHVVETSSFQLALTDTFHPWIAVLLNVSPDHLDRHESYAEYRAAKARIFANQTGSDTLVINADDPEVLALARQGRARQLPYQLVQPAADGVGIAGASVVERSAAGERPLFPISAVRLAGRHLLSDVLAAAAVGVAAGAAPAAMHRAVAAFRGLEHTLEEVGTIAGVRFVNDSKATNVAAARAAIECCGAGTVVIMGGRFKGGDLGTIADALAARQAAVVALGEARPLLHKTLGAAVPVHDADTMRAAVRRAFELARPRGTVLLAPACASVDMFENAAARGETFKAEAARLARERARDVR